MTANNLSVSQVTLDAVQATAVVDRHVHQIDIGALAIPEQIQALRAAFTRVSDAGTAGGSSQQYLQALLTLATRALLAAEAGENSAATVDTEAAAPTEIPPDPYVVSHPVFVRKLVDAALQLLLAERACLSSHPDPQTERATVSLCLTALDLVAEVDQLPRAAQPVGWRRSHARPPVDLRTPRDLT